MTIKCIKVLGLSVFLFLLLGCQASNGRGRVTAQDFYQDEKVVDLLKAAAEGNIRRIEVLVADGVNVNQIGRDGMTPLLWALMAKNKKSMGLLLKLGASPDVAIASGGTVTSLASGMKNPEFLKIILEYGANPNVLNSQDEDKPTPIFVAISYFNIENVSALIDSGANLNCQDSVGEDTPIMLAASLNQWEMVYALLVAGADYNLKNRWGNTITYFIENNGIVAPSELYQWRQKVVDFLRTKGISVRPAVPLSRIE